MNGILETITNCMAASFWAAPLLALVAGIITSFTPCSLATVPMLLTCVGASKASPGKAFRLSLAMAAGMAVTFGVFGSVASAIGHHMHEAGHWWAVLMGILMVLMALQVFGVVNVIPHIHFDEHTMKRGYAGAFLTGAPGYGGASCTCCAAWEKHWLGDSSYGFICTWAQHFAHRSRYQLQLCREDDGKSKV